MKPLRRCGAWLDFSIFSTSLARKSHSCGCTTHEPGTLGVGIEPGTVPRDPRNIAERIRNARLLGDGSVVELATAMHSGRRQRLRKIGFTPARADALSGEHTRNFM